MGDEFGPKSVAVLVTWDANDHGGNVHFEVCVNMQQFSTSCLACATCLTLSNCSCGQFGWLLLLSAEYQGANQSGHCNEFSHTAVCCPISCAVLQAFQCSEQAVQLYKDGWFLPPADEPTGVSKMKNPKEPTLDEAIIVAGVDKVPSPSCRSVYLQTTALQVQGT